MNKKIFSLVIAILIGAVTAVNAKINYVPLYIVDTHTDVKVIKRAPSVPLFITQDNHKLTLPELEDSVTFMLIKHDVVVYTIPRLPSQTTVNIPSEFVGDYEVRLNVEDRYYYGFITLEKEAGIPSETTLWENITLLGSNTPQEVILDNIMGLNVVEYNYKTKNINNLSGEDLFLYSEEDKEEYLRRLEEMQAEQRANRRIGLLANELKAVFPQLVTSGPDGLLYINYLDLVPVLISCIQELKIQLDSRTEQLVDVMMSRSIDPLDVNAARAIVGTTLLPITPTSVNEPARVRFLIGNDATSASIVITDMSGRSIRKVPVSPFDDSVSIDGSALIEGIYLCTLYVDGNIVDTKRLVKTK